MIICFSGTGNSRTIADFISDSLGDEILRLSPGLMADPSRAKIFVNDHRLIWVLPIHSWGMPYTVEKVLKHAEIFGNSPMVHYLVCTCGDDIGYADKHWRKLVEKRGWKAGSAFSVQMPNTYVFMKGFDVDPAELAEQKLHNSFDRIDQIVEKIKAEDNTTVDVVRGSMPWLKTYVVRPWFNWYMTRTAPFHYTDACKGCGRCARNCPLMVISMVDNRPHWKKGHCTMCSRCYHCCPSHAVAYGSATEGKGQYLCPGYKISN